MKSIDTLVFDFDSTLAEFTLNFRLIERQLRSLASAFFDPIEGDSEFSAFDYLDIMSERLGQMDPAMGLEYHSRGRLTIAAVELAAAQKGKLLASTRPLLKRLRRQKVKTCIISHGSTAAVEYLFPEVAAFCDVFVPREEVSRVKPHPEHLLTALERCVSSPHHTVMITGDGACVEMAKEAGTLTGLVIPDPSGAKDLLGKCPDFISEDLISLVSMVIPALTSEG